MSLEPHESLCFVFNFVRLLCDQADHEKTARNKDTQLRAAKNELEQIDFILMKVLMSAGIGNPATKPLTYLCSASNLIVLLLPLVRTCFKRSFLLRHCYFSFTCALRFFNHTSTTKQTNKFRAYAADTNIDMSYEIERARERLWTLILNICTRQPEHPSTKSHCLLSQKGEGVLGQTGIKLSLLTV